MEQRSSPPRIFIRFFRWFCHPDLHTYIEGDLFEVYYDRVRRTGKRKADLGFIVDVLLLFRIGIIRSVRPTLNPTPYGMYKNYLITAWRNLAKSKAFSFINISGLSLGLACSMLIALWVRDEYQVDAFHEDGDRLFVVTSCEFSGSEINGSYDTPGLLGEELKKVMPEVEYGCNFGWYSFHTFAVDDKVMKLPGNFAGGDFFRMFSYPLLAGTKESALKGPESIAISRKMARAFFGSPAEAIDKTLKFENYKELKVTAVFEDLGTNTSDKFEYLVNWDLFVERQQWVKDFNNSGPITYLKLREHADAAAFGARLRTFLKKYVNTYSDLERLELGLQPFSEKYLYSNFRNGYIDGGRIEYVRLFRLVAIFILLIACINFMNLSTARAVKRAREIGVRKVVGAVKGSLVGQFLLEALLFTAIAVVMSIVMLSLLLPHFNLLAGKNIVSPLSDYRFWIGTVALTLLAAIVAGSYPAFLLSSFKPLAVLKNNFRVHTSSGVFRKGLVVFQFALSMIFIMSMIVITRQVNYIQTKHLGYQKSDLLYLSVTGTITTNFEAFKHEVLSLPGVVNVSRISQRPVSIGNSTADVEWDGKDPNSKPTFTQAAVGYDFIKTMGATLLYGRDFSADRADSASYIINETALRVLGFKDPVGMPLTFWNMKGTIIGVVKDFHFNSLHVPIKPLVLRLAKEKSWGWLLIRTESGKTQQALTALETLHQKFNPDFPFAHQFADEEYHMLYHSEQVVEQLSRYFAFLAIFISSLGLLGLSIFTAGQRTKEMSIRKVLGADVLQVVALLSKDFMKLVIASIVLSSPLAYFIMKEWLRGFEYRITIAWWMFALAAACAIAGAVVAVSVQTIRAARVNPVDNLKAE